LAIEVLSWDLEIRPLTLHHNNAVQHRWKSKNAKYQNSWNTFCWNFQHR